MTVELISDKNEVYAGGYARTYNSVDEARDQAIHDIRCDVSPGPNRIEEDGNIVADRQALQKLARA